MKFCTNCGFKMNDNVKFCSKCGNQQISIEQNNNVPNNDDGKIRSDSEFAGDRKVQQANMNNTNQVKQPNYKNTNNLQQGGFNNNQQQNKFRSNNQQQTYADKFTIGQPQHLDFSQSIGYIWKNKFNFSTTVQDNQKSIFWWSVLMIIGAGICGYIVLGIPAIAMDSVFLFLIYGLFEFALYFMIIPPTMRRLNYLGQNKNMAWLLFIPIAQLYIIYLMFIDRSQINHG